MISERAGIDAPGVRFLRQPAEADLAGLDGAGFQHAHGLLANHCRAANGAEVRPAARQDPNSDRHHERVYRARHTRHENCGIIASGKGPLDQQVPCATKPFEDGEITLACNVAEADSGTFCAAMGYPPIRCNPCGSQAGLQRQQVQQIINGWGRSSPGRRQVIFRALMNTRPSHLLGPQLLGLHPFDFAGLSLGLLKSDEYSGVTRGSVKRLLRCRA